MSSNPPIEKQNMAINLMNTVIQTPENLQNIALSTGLSIEEVNTLKINLDTATRLVKLLPADSDETISTSTGLSIDHIKNLREKSSGGNRRRRTNRRKNRKTKRRNTKRRRSHTKKR
jgi:hypothetical protein